VINKYTFEFTSTNKIPSTGVVVLIWPQTVELFDLEQCKISARNTYKDNCQVFAGKRTIVFENAFQDVSTFYQGKIVIEKEGFENIEFAEAEYTDGFVIQTYTDNSLDYIIDQLSEVKPELECGYACK